MRIIKGISITYDGETKNVQCTCVSVCVLAIDGMAIAHAKREVRKKNGNSKAEAATAAAIAQIAENNNNLNGKLMWNNNE